MNQAKEHGDDPRTGRPRPNDVVTGVLLHFGIPPVVSDREGYGREEKP